MREVIAKKIRRETRINVSKALAASVKAIMLLPLRGRLSIAWRIVVKR
jgi:hypothetical protein